MFNCGNSTLFYSREYVDQGSVDLARVFRFYCLGFLCNSGIDVMPIEIEDIFNSTPVIPVLTLERLEQAIPLAGAIRKGGLSVIEVTLRTSVALEAIQSIKEEFPDMIIGAGTITSDLDVQKAVNAGAMFLTSPGSTPAIIDASLEVGTPFLPGISTVSEVIALLNRGIMHMKFFPAAVSGGVSMLDSIYRPFPQVTFCPAGGINQEMAMDYFGLANVSCVSGSWITPPSLVEREKWCEIEAISRKAYFLRSFQ